jgi:hypothetical protein
MVSICPNDKLILTYCVLSWPVNMVFFPSLQTHCPSNPKFDFYGYMVRALEADFRKVVGIR